MLLSARASSCSHLPVLAAVHYVLSHALPLSRPGWVSLASGSMASATRAGVPSARATRCTTLSSVTESFPSSGSWQPRKSSTCPSRHPPAVRTLVSTSTSARTRRQDHGASRIQLEAAHKPKDNPPHALSLLGLERVMRERKGPTDGLLTYTRHKISCPGGTPVVFYA